MGPRLIFEFRTFDGVRKYTLGWEKKDRNVDARIRMMGTGLNVNPATSSLEITAVDKEAGTISGRFDLYFDTDTPDINQRANAAYGLHFANGTFQDVKIDIY